jgi:hypothetical protein
LGDAVNPLLPATRFSAIGDRASRFSEHFIILFVGSVDGFEGA